MHCVYIGGNGGNISALFGDREWGHDGAECFRNTK